MRNKYITINLICVDQEGFKLQLTKTIPYTAIEPKPEYLAEQVEDMTVECPKGTKPLDVQMQTTDVHNKHTRKVIRRALKQAQAMVW